MADTFAELGIPFPLFEAPTDGTEYSGIFPCRLCRRPGHAFRLGIGDDLIVECAACGEKSGLDADDREDGTCPRCGAVVPFPVAADTKELKVCHGCFRAGRAALTKNTELGMIRWQDAVRGVTHGAPGLDRDHPEYDIVPTDEEDWFAARLPSEVMFELLRTPTYSTWQGERWLFCCRRPMVYVGDWTEDDFDRHAPDGDGRAHLLRVIDDAYPEMWGGLGRTVSTYVFRCPACGRHRGHFDMD